MIPTFSQTLAVHGWAPLRRVPVTTLQINVGKRCNQACHHCHVDAGPKRTEMMTAATADRLLALIDATPSIELVDITGGAPELNPEFRRLVTAVRSRGHRVIDRCNLTVLLEPGQEDLATFLAEQRVEITASLPCYGLKNVDAQRGKGVFDKSIAALRRLNGLGYGDPATGLVLDLVYNPGGPFLPPAQEKLEADYKRELAAQFGLVFNHLLTITNMPISRFADALRRAGQHAEYMSLLVNHFNPATLDGLMCRSLLSVGYDGQIYDCDFNQMLELPVGGGVRATIWNVDTLAAYDGAEIGVNDHCYGCTAGAGSSCGGALS